MMMERNEYDEKFVKNLKTILDTGCEYESRAVWMDDTDGPRDFAKCIKAFGLVTEYNSNNENMPPIGSLRKLAIKNCVDELLWIWQKKSNNIKDLNSHIWDEWADKNGSIGAAYGFQVRSKIHHVQHNEYLGKDEDGCDMYDCYPLYLDQIDYVIWKLKNDPFSRRIITNLYSVEDISCMGLEPCCYMCTWNVTTDKDGNKYLNLLLNQRSQDMIVANNWNVFQYWVLQNLIANEVNMRVGKLVHMIADAHIYDRHVDIAKELIQDYYDDYVSAPPEVEFKCEKFYDFTVDDLIVHDYKYHKDIKGIQVAV